MIECNCILTGGLQIVHKEIIETTGVTYPILFATEEVQDTIKANMFPTSYFLDSEGHILGDPVVGSHSAEDWESYILEHLK